jgi:Uma2 family endonuclease
MVATGAMDDQPVELLEGLLVDVSPHGPLHGAIVEELTARLAGARARLRVQLPIEIPPDSVPEPDLALLKAPPPHGEHPRSALLVVEVAVTSHEVDRGAKAALYARAGVPVYWLVDVPGRAVEVRTGPGPEGYGRCAVRRAGARVPSPIAGVADLDVATLFDAPRAPVAR